MSDIYNISVPLRLDEQGMVGRECNNPDCKKYFKVRPGAGIADNPIRFCPYCGYKGNSREFFTEEQIEYAKSIAFRHVTDMIGQKLKKIERHSFKGPLFSLDIKIKLTPTPIRYYAEKQLQEDVICENCRCEYAIYGMFAVCPDCGEHNLLQIFAKNLDLVKKQVELENELYKKFGETNRKDIDDLMKDLRSKLIEDACENTVTVFETFCKQVYNQSIAKAVNPSMLLSGNPFQSVDKTKDIFLSQFNLDILSCLSQSEIDNLYLLFNKRHILTHNSGIIDKKFLRNTGLQKDILNHKIEISKTEVISVLESLRKIVVYIKNKLF
jgi:hypothetical protein